MLIIYFNRLSRMIAIIRLARDKENPTLAINLTFGKCSFNFKNYYFLFILNNQKIFTQYSCVSLVFIQSV
jgi:hypothetical protein